MTKHVDVLDRANQIADEDRAYHIRRITERKRAARTDHCEECGTFIPMQRQIATGGTDHCIDCQSVNERRR